MDSYQTVGKETSMAQVWREGNDEARSLSDFTRQGKIVSKGRAVEASKIELVTPSAFACEQSEAGRRGVAGRERQLFRKGMIMRPSPQAVRGRG